MYKIESERKLDLMIQVNGQDVSLPTPFNSCGLR